MVTDNTTMADVDKAIHAAWLSYQTRALNGDASADRILTFVDELLEKRSALAQTAEAT